MASRSGFSTFESVLALFLAICAVAAAQGPNNTPSETKTWIGPPSGAWGDGANWSTGTAPDSNDHAIVPQDSGEIVAPAAGIHVRRLELQASTPANAADDTVIRGNPDLHIHVGADGGSVGAHCTLAGAAGAAGVAGPPMGGASAQSGGEVRITSEGPLTNDGKILGGAGGFGPTGAEARQGGAVSVDAAVFVNAGEVFGGAGGGKTGEPGKCGNSAREGGSVTVRTRLPGSIFGKLLGGAAGLFQGGPPFYGNGRVGGVVVNGAACSFAAGDQVSGERASLHSSGTLDFAGAAAGAVVATDAIRVTAPTLDLTGVPAGTHVFQAPQVCFRCDTVLLDPGVVLADLCSAGAPGVHVGPVSCATESSSAVFGPESFDDAAATPPPLWSAQTLQGATGFLFDNPSNLPLHPNFRCHAAIANAQMSAPGPVVAALTTPPVFLPPSTTGPVLLQWAQRYQPCPCPNSSAQVTLTVDGNPVLVTTITTPTPQFDFRQIDVTPFLPGGAGNHVLSATFTLSAGFNAGFWILDDVTFLIPWLPLPGQPSQPGVALLDVNDARNANDVPPYFALPGPYFTHVGVGETAMVHVQGPPNQPVVFGTGFLVPGILPLAPFGTLDLDPLGLLLVDPAFATPPFGPLNLPFLVPPTLSGLTLGLQAAVVQPGGGVGITNAVEIRFGP